MNVCKMNSRESCAEWPSHEMIACYVKKKKKKRIYVYIQVINFIIKQKLIQQL